MRNLLIGILLAGAAVTPALAQDNGNGVWHRGQRDPDRQEAHQERQQVREERQQVRQEQQQVREVQQQARQQQQVRAEQGQRGGWSQRFERGPQQIQDGQRGNFDGRRFERRPDAAPQGAVQEQAYRNRGPLQVEQNGNGGWSRNYGYRQGNVVQQPREWNRNGSGWSGQRSGDYRQGQVVQQQYRDRSRYSGGTSWNRDWRNDRHYDWRHYRDSHRSTFHLGIYYDPFGYGYRSFGIGYRLPQVYFGQQYWFDPGLYGLPYPPPGTQWVRYWNDALLVDIYTGEVVDVIQGFFW
jgi:Ni/Co efflux regulator RcnB